MGAINFIDNDGTFSIERPENYSYLYFPIAGEAGLKSALTPNLGGDSKIDQETFLLEPVSVENLHNNRSTRNFWCKVEGKGYWSVTGASAEEEHKKFSKEQDDSILTAGLMWQTVKRISEKYQLEAEITSFVPVNDNVEIMHVKISNRSEELQAITPTAAIPIYGRSADNIRDHRNVTSMLHRISTLDYGVSVKPTMSFDERGHRRNHRIYFVMGTTGSGEKPVSFYPTVDAFLGEGGTFTHPAAVYGNGKGVSAQNAYAGKEAMGGIRFDAVSLGKNQAAEYIIIMGVTEDKEQINRMLAAYGTSQKVKQALEEVKEYWQAKVNVRYQTGNREVDSFMRWVSFQPFLRRLYGCSFLPYHDYGRGGRGWRDLWQDCLSLLLMDPDEVREMILANYGGVRIDGTNATIIGHGQGEFIADRNGISRVWMDHGVWPFLTTRLYMDQTGDIGILTEKAPYFKDSQSKRGRDNDDDWNDTYGMQQRTAGGSVYTGTVLEHLLLEHLCAFYEVGEHNVIRLRGADWNDALDMAEENGESVAFTCAYAGNLRQLAECLGILHDKGICEEVELLEEVLVLLTDNRGLYEDVEKKKKVLDEYLNISSHDISGNTIRISIEELIENLNHKADWLMEHIRKQEWIQNGDEGWFNSYYDNSRHAVEGISEKGVRMMLIGQVFAIMSGTAANAQTAQICKSADHYLYDAAIGGYRLNTDFNELKFDMGRMFGFAYGEKENGAVFSHMTVMYANALYRRGFVKEGYKALKTLADTALDFETSKIYPGIPEYFNSEGRGMYHYLTGAASWYMMTMITEVFGVHGENGDLVVSPRLVREQFDESGKAVIRLCFAGKKFEVVFCNEGKLEYGSYQIGAASCDRKELQVFDNAKVIIGRQTVETMEEGTHRICINLVAPQELAYEGYDLVWEEQFDGDFLNLHDWNIETHEPGWVNNELQEYKESSDNIFLKDGKLVLKPVKLMGEDGTISYISGRVNTQNKHDFMYGIFEAKLKVPKGQGFLPAFWMMPTDEYRYGQWPVCGEIDIMEVRGHEIDTCYGTIHYGSPHSESQGSYMLNTGNFSDEYHVFSLKWEREKLSWYVDRKLIYTESVWYSTSEGHREYPYPAPFDQPFYMILNLAVGGNWPGEPDDTTDFDNAAFVIDYVRVYQKDTADSKK